MVPVLANQFFLRGGKFSEAGYVSVFDGEEVNIYDGHNAKIRVSEKAILIWRRYPRTRLWRIPLQSQVTNFNMHALLLNEPTGQEYLNSLYTVSSSAAVLEHIELFNNNPDRPSAA